MKLFSRAMPFILGITLLILTPGCTEKLYEWFPFLKSNIISTDELKTKLDADEDIIVANVDTDEDYDACHIKNSINIPLEDLEEAYTTLDKNQTIVLYCTDEKSNRSKKAYDILRKKKFTQVLIYKGGITEWKAKGFQTSGVCKTDYLKEE